VPISTYYAKHKVSKAKRDRLDDRLKFERELFIELVKNDHVDNQKNSESKKIIYDTKYYGNSKIKNKDVKK